jgi:hypothetical protein
MFSIARDNLRRLPDSAYRTAQRRLPRRLVSPLFGSAAALLTFLLLMVSMPSGGWARETQTTCGTSWKVAKSGGQSIFGGIAAITQSDVWAVGYHGSSSSTTVGPVALHWNGSTWSTSTLPSIKATASEFNAVSMVSHSSGWAVGYSQVPTGAQFNTGAGEYDTLAEYWNGTQWTVQTTPNIGPGTNLLIGISATSSSDAWAVGYGSTSDSTPRQTLAEHWDGSGWKIVPTTDDGTGNNVLLGVKAVASDDVWAVGYSTLATSQNVPLIEHWNGSSWTAIPTDPATPHGVFTAVSASSSSDAWAVGYTDGFEPLLEHWNGTSWSLVQPPAMPGVVQIARGVVDESPTDVRVVGSSYEASIGAYVGFVIRWNGSSWTRETPATPSTPINDQNQFQFRAVAASPGGGSIWAAGGLPGGLVEVECPSPSTAQPSDKQFTTMMAAPSGQAAWARSRESASRKTARSSETLGGSGFPANATQNLRVVDEAQAAGIGPETIGHSAIVADFNGDGAPDIFLSRAGTLYLNNGNATFSQVDQGSFLTDDRFTCVAVQMAGDVRPDIFCTIGADHGNGLKGNEFWIQGPSTTFTNAADTYGLLDPTGRGRAAIFFNVNGSSTPAIFVANDPFRADGLPDPDRLFIETPTGFVDSPQYGLDLPIGGECMSAGDYLRSGYQDLLVCSADGSLQLFQNNGGSGFLNVTAHAGLSGINAKDAIFADVNGDGWPDIVVVMHSKLSVMLQNPTTHVFTSSYSFPLSGGGTVAAGDANGDGALDLLVTQGRGSSQTNPPNLLLLNNGSGTSYTNFPIPEPSTGASGSAFPINYENNGMTDFLVLNSVLETPEPVQLLTFFSGATSANGKSFSRHLRTGFRRLPTGNQH